MLQIELMRWEQARAAASRIRYAVFVEEQGVPVEIELDEHDAVCIHALAFDGGAAVGTGRLLPDGHIGRMAVLREFRGRGVGSAILAKLIEAAARRYWSSAQGTYVLDESIFDVWVGGTSTASLHTEFAVQGSTGSSTLPTEKP